MRRHAGGCLHERVATAARGRARLLAARVTTAGITVHQFYSADYLALPSDAPSAPSASAAPSAAPGDAAAAKK